jgi:hypothetical protein
VKHFKNEPRGERPTAQVVYRASFVSLARPDRAGRKAEFSRFVKDLAGAKAWLAAQMRAGA